jgi:hypothetical protein
MVQTSGFPLFQQITALQYCHVDTNTSAFFNDITYVAPKVPTLYSVLTTGDAATNPAVYGRDTHTFVLEQGQVVEIVLNNDDAGKHPFHLHGELRLRKLQHHISKKKSNHLQDTTSRRSGDLKQTLDSTIRTTIPSSQLDR